MKRYPPVRTRPLALAVAVVFALLAARSGGAETIEVAELGRLDFPNSGSPRAQEPFARGVLLLHSFEYDDAREAFREAREIDPGFALAAWGEAMTHNHPLWREQNLEAARAALERLAPSAGERASKAPTERERAYLEAVEILYGDGEKRQRDAAYEEAMRRLAQRHPDDLEARAFYALSILGTTEGVRDFRTFMRAAAVAEEVFAANPRHPGAAHYLIHSYDDPIHAPLGLRAARVYAGIAPAASHAQHMISHIYVALGRWEESVDSNRTAFEVSRLRAERKGLGTDQLNFHALHWLEYSYLQLGRLDEARGLLGEMAGYARESASRRALWYHAAMRATWAVESGGLEPPEGPGAEAAGIEGEVFDRFAAGYAALLRGQVDAARETLAELTRRIDQAERAGDLRDQELTEARVLETELRALAELEAGREEAALTLLGDAAEAEAALPLEYGPPEIVKPSHELLGEVLLKLGRPGEARVQFETALSRAPRRSLSLAGLAAAARADGDAAAADRACAELASIRAQARPAPPPPAACAG